LFLYRHVLNRQIGDLGEVIRARRPKRLPVVMTREEVKAVLSHLSGDKWLMANVMYGAGLRLMECLRLRVQHVDFAANQIIVRDGKGNKDRVTMLPQVVKRPLLERRVLMPYALARKYPNAAADWRWQWVFPQEKRWINKQTGRQGRHHVHETLVQRKKRGHH